MTERIEGTNEARVTRALSASEKYAAGTLSLARCWSALQRCQAGQDQIERDLIEIKSRLRTLDSGQATVIHHIGTLSGAVAGEQVSVDRMRERIGRIEHHLELL